MGHKVSNSCYTKSQAKVTRSIFGSAPTSCLQNLVLLHRQTTQAVIPSHPTPEAGKYKPRRAFNHQTEEDSSSTRQNPLLSGTHPPTPVQTSSSTATKCS